MSILSIVESGDQDRLAKRLVESQGDESLKESFKGEVNYRSKTGLTPLDTTAVLGRKSLLDLLIESGADINATNKSGYTAMHHSAAWGRLDCLQALVEKGGILTNKTRHQETPRAVAQRYGHLHCVQLLDCYDVCMELEEGVKKTRLTLADTEKISGKWNKDDRSKVTALCNETADWLLHNIPMSTSLHKVLEQKTHFEEKLQPYLVKLTSK